MLSIKRILIHPLTTPCQTLMALSLPSRAGRLVRHHETAHMFGTQRLATRRLDARTFPLSRFHAVQAGVIDRSNDQAFINPGLYAPQPILNPPSYRRQIHHEHQRYRRTSRHRENGRKPTVDSGMNESTTDSFEPISRQSLM